ncbi:hypothetical protein LTR17_025072 [Elasticomyces elasticus]|nr:hypothetical protein LTR17_025072 [Elasticomyces elasticus]
MQNRPSDEARRRVDLARAGLAIAVELQEAENREQYYQGVKSTHPKLDGLKKGDQTYSTHDDFQVQMQRPFTDGACIKITRGDMKDGQRGCGGTIRLARAGWRDVLFPFRHVETLLTRALRLRHESGVTSNSSEGKDASYGVTVIPTGATGTSSLLERSPQIVDCTFKGVSDAKAAESAMNKFTSACNNQLRPFGRRRQVIDLDSVYAVKAGWHGGSDVEGSTLGGEGIHQGTLYFLADAIFFASPAGTAEPKPFYIPLGRKTKLASSVVVVANKSLTGEVLSVSIYVEGVVEAKFWTRRRTEPRVRKVTTATTWQLGTAGISQSSVPSSSSPDNVTLVVNAIAPGSRMEVWEAVKKYATVPPSAVDDVGTTAQASGSSRCKKRKRDQVEDEDPVEVKLMQRIWTDFRKGEGPGPLRPYEE